MGHADLLREETEGVPAAKGHMDAMIRDLAFTARLTNQLRSFGRQQVVAPRPTDLNILVESVSPLLNKLVGEDAVLQADLEPGLPPMMVDPTQLEQVLMNLVTNGRDAVERGGYVRVVTRRRGSAAAELRVEDNGRGMDASTLAKAAEPFFTTGGGGDHSSPASLGLGLATVQDIVDRCAGDLEIRSSVGEGTVVRVLLPSASGCTVSSVRSGEVPLPVEPTETLLVVDDEAVIRDLLKRVLEARGYRVLVAPSGPAAVDRVLGYAGPLHLLITDVMMPEMNGQELADTLRGLRPDLRVLYISGYEEHIIAPTGVLDEKVAFLAKPFRMADALDAVRGVLDDQLPSDSLSLHDSLMDLGPPTP